MFDIPEELKKLPQKPGVYLMRDADGVIIYVGKAISLRNRVRQYFHTNPAGAKVAHMVGHIAEFEYIVTDNELEALILERNLIKEHHPKYNILLKDDKNFYPYLKLTLSDPYPRLHMTRRHLKDHAKYYGPFTGGTALKETLELVHKIWPLRRCAKTFPRPAGERPCLNYHIGLCKAPCAGLITEEEYARLLHEVTEFLNGKRQPVLTKLEEQMAACAEQLEFEKAAELRDTLAALRTLDEKQKIENAGGDDQDVIALALGIGLPPAQDGADSQPRNSDTALAQVFFVRGGKLLGREHYMVSVPHGDFPSEDNALRERTMSEFIKQFYGETTFIPRELILENDISEREVIMEWLSALKGRNVVITVPQKGEKKKLVRLAATNAQIALAQFGEQMKREQMRTAGALGELAAALGLSELKRIEAYDISNTQGYETVASMVVFDNGRPKRSDYRKFKIKTVIGANDVAAIEEVVRRRFLRYQAEHGDPRGKFSILPDILFIDGGQNQVHAAEAALQSLGMALPVCGMVKDDRHRTRGLYFHDRELSLPYTSEGFKLLTRIQDEVHRFAIEYHRKLRESIHSVLDEIPGVGPARRKSLMKHFGSIEAIHRADTDALKAVPGMDRRTAEAVFTFFHRP